MTITSEDLKDLFPYGIKVEEYDSLLSAIDALELLASLRTPAKAETSAEVWLHERTVESVGAMTAVRDAYSDYLRWSQARGEKGLGCVELLRTLEPRGLRVEQTTEGWFVTERRMV